MMPIVAEKTVMHAPMYPVRENVALLDIEAVERHVGLLFGRHDWEAGQALQIRGIGETGTPQEGKPAAVRTFHPVNGDPLPQIVAALEDWAQRHIAAYIVPAVFIGDRAVEANMRATPCAIADIDSGDVAVKLAHLTEWLGPPTMTVRSGGVAADGQDKRHAYWTLQEMCEPARVARLNEKIAAKAGADPAFKRCTQVIRIAGSVHAKGGGARPVEIERLDPALLYDLAELEERAELMRPLPGLEPVRTPTAGPSLTPPGGGMNFWTPGDETGGDRTQRLAQQMNTPVMAGGQPGASRWDNFNAVTGHYIHCVRTSLMAPDAALEAVRGWCLANQQPPWPDERIEREFRGLLGHDVRHSGPLQPPPAAPAPSILSAQTGLGELEGHLADLSLWTAGSYLSEPPPVSWIAEGLIQTGVISMLVAEGGVGKTYAVLELALKVAARPAMQFPLTWFGQPVTTGGAAAFITAEDSRDEIHRRLARLDPDGGLRRAAGDRLVTVPLMSMGGTFPFVEEHTIRNAYGVGSRFAGASDRFKALVARLSSLPDLRLVIVDTLGATLHGEENRANVVQEYYAAVNLIAGGLGAATLITHHVRKPGQNDQGIRSIEQMKSAVRGSTAVIAVPRAVLGLWADPSFRQRMRAMKLTPKPRVLHKLGVLKANNEAMLQEEKTLIRLDNAMLVDVTAQDVLKRKEDELRARYSEAIFWLVTAIRFANEARHPYTKTGQSSLLTRRNELPPVLAGIGEKKIRAIADEALNMGVLVHASPGEGSKIKSLLDLPGGVYAINGGAEIRAGAYTPPPWGRYIFDPNAGEVVLRDDV